MSRDSKRRRRASILSETYALEDRVAMSSFGPLHPNAPPLLEGAPTLPDHHEIHVVQARAQSAGHPVRAALAPTAKRWSWLADTYWYVPAQNLPSVLFNSSTGTLAPVSDQTVYQITGYRNGYFWGKTVTQLGSSPASSSSLVGSVTPQGKVLLTFTSTGSTSSPSVTEGYGTMRRKFGQWTMENQMFTLPGQTLQIGHWAYMFQTHPGLPSWDSLPSAGVSVPTFMSQYDGSGPQPIGS